MIPEPLKLERPLVFFDLETTGVKIGADRIVQIAAVKRYPDGKRTQWSSLVNPGMPIPPGATAIHRITDAMVANSPTFDALASTIAKAFVGCDIAGFNVRKFDWPFLLAEFGRVGFQVDWQPKFVDVMAIFHAFVRRDLSAASMHYLGREHVDAHSAEADVTITEEVLWKQLEKHPEVPRSPAEIHDWLFPTDPSAVDSGGRFRWEGDEVVLAFGKHAGTKLRQVDSGFLRWMTSASFIAEDAKAIARDAINGKYPTKGKAV